ncbi:MAG: threonine ammonia-lyase [Armatimonadetes bacterium]|nr:threonine ammonia-lyase [Armatimonadota bacterium]
MISAHDIVVAAETLRRVLAPTPCRRSEVLSGWFGGEVWLKLENLHVTGSFKERGAYVRLAALTAAERAAGVVTASAGNHAQAVAYHARHLGIRAVVVMPQRTAQIKVASTRELGGEVMLWGEGFDDAYARAEELAAAKGLVFVPPFDDDRVIAGQGTIGLEILEQVPHVSTVIVPVGGGGLIGGIATAVKAARPHARVVGVEAAAYPSMRASAAAGEVTLVPGAPTLADGIAVKRVSPRTLELVQRHVDDLMAVQEETIARAVLTLIERQKTVAEGAAAATLAVLLEGQVSVDGPTVLVISGGNIDVSRLDDILTRGLAADGRRLRLQAVMPDVPGQLHRLTGVIAELGGNVLEVVHDRAFGQAALGETMTTLTVETRGEEHLQEILEALTAAGFTHVERVRPATRARGAGPVPGY